MSDKNQLYVLIEYKGYVVLIGHILLIDPQINKDSSTLM